MGSCSTVWVKGLFSHASSFSTLLSSSISLSSIYSINETLYLGFLYFWKDSFFHIIKNFTPIHQFSANISCSGHSRILFFFFSEIRILLKTVLGCV